MTLGDLYSDVKLHSEVETMIMTGGGGCGRTYGKDRRGRGMRKGHRKGRNQELYPEVGTGENVWVEEMAPPLQSCVNTNMCMVWSGNYGGGGGRRRLVCAAKQSDL